MTPYILHERLARILAKATLTPDVKRTRALHLMRSVAGTDPAHPEEAILSSTLCTDLADLFSQSDDGDAAALATRLLTKAALAGHTAAQAKLAIRLLKGEGVARDPAAGVRWLRKAASKDHVPSQRRLGICLQIGLGAEQDIDEAEHWLATAGRNRDIPSAYRLGVCKRRGTGARRDVDRARTLLSIAVKGGNARAAHHLHGIDTATTDSDGSKPSGKAVRLLRLAAESGVPEAQFQLGSDLFLYNEAKKAEGMAWLRKAAAAGIPIAQGFVSLLGIDVPDIVPAHELEKWTAISKCSSDRTEHTQPRISMDEPDLADITVPDPAAYDAEPACWLVDAARAGDADAQYLLSQCIAAPEVDAMPNKVLATYWVEAAAAQGHADALYEIACRRYEEFNFDDEQPIPDRAFDEIADRLRKIASRGHAKAQLLLARILANQGRCKKDKAEAIRWLRRSAGLGDVDAMHCLGAWLTDGKYTEETPGEGMKWLMLAADRGNDDARERIKEFNH